MSFHSIPTARLFRALPALALGIAAAACGGGGEEAAGSASIHAAEPAAAARQADAARSPAPAHFVLVAGCVLDRHYLPTTGTPVRALAADGRLLGNAESDGQGRFTLRLPARSEVMLQVDRPQGETLAMRVETASSTWEACLLDEQA